jgi:PAS domain S-box-containing protein
MYPRRVDEEMMARGHALRPRLGPMAASEHSTARTEPSGWDPAAQAMYRAAQAVTQRGGASLFADLVRELADTLRVSTVFVAVFSDETRRHMRTLAVVLDGSMLKNFEYPLEGSPCAKVVGRAFRHVVRGVAAEFPPGTIFGAKGMDSYAAFPLFDSDGNSLGLLVAMDRQPIADGALAEALLKIFAGRMVAEIERSHVDQAFRAAALAVSSTHGDSVFVELVRLLAAILHVEVAFISRLESEEPQVLRMLAMQCDQQMLQDMHYPVHGTPCEQVLGQRFRVYPDRLQELFPEDADAEFEGVVSYAGYPLLGQNGAPLGTVAIASRLPLLHVERIESVLQIFAVRAAAEIERQRATEALRRSEASYRAIFEAAEDAISIHDWDSGAIIDVNPKACSNYGYAAEELKRLTVADISANEAPFDAAHAMQYLRQARLGRCPPFEWRRRNKDGSLHWDEVRLKPVQIDGRQHVLAFTREITEHKAALAALQASEQQYRALFDSSADAMGLWSDALCLVDINQAFTRISGWTRDDVIGSRLGDREGEPEVEQRLELIRGALAGREGRVETLVPSKDGRRFEVEVRYIPVRFGGVDYALSVARDITERNAALKALRAREEQYRAAFDGSSDAMVMWNRDVRIVDVNQAFERVYGYRRDDVVGQTFGSRIPEDDVAARVVLIRQALAGREGLLETRGVRSDGRVFDVELRYLPIRYGGEPHVLAVGRDITERRRGEQALRDSEAQYRAIFNASADALVLRDAEFRIVDVNATYERMSGMPHAEVVGVDRIIANPAEVAPRVRALHQRALAGETVELEVPFMHRDGTRYQIELRGVPIRHRGQPHVLYIGRDITERKRAEAALRDSEEQYRAIFNASADALLLRDAEHRVVEVNPAYLSLSGYSRDEVLGATRVLTQSDALLQREYRQQHERALAGETLRFEVQAARKDGTRFSAEVRGVPVAYRGQPHVLYAARDITERRAADEQRERLETQLRQAQKMEAIGQLTGGIAHDFNNILTSVIGYLVLGQERAGLLGDERLQRQLDKAHLAAQRARELIAQMLAFARRQRGQRRVLPLAPLVRQTLQLLRSTLPTSVSVNTLLPPDETGPCVDADAVQLEQVLFNLCINARDAIGESGLIKVRLRESGSAFTCASCRMQLTATRWVELSVADNGSGIEPATLERMFEPFYSTKEVGRGSGMGLAMVHGIVHDHGGHVAVETAAQAGSVFRVLLPPAQGEALAVPEATPLAATARPLAGRVMVVDDEPMVGDFMAELLEGWGLQVVLLRDPLQALDWLEQPDQALDLLITDQTMPQLSGLQLAQRAVGLRQGLPVLLYTGNAEGIDAAEAKRHGVCGVLRKPVDADTLYALMQHCLGQPQGVAAR